METVKGTSRKRRFSIKRSTYRRRKRGDAAICSKVQCKICGDTVGPDSPYVELCSKRCAKALYRLRYMENKNGNSFSVDDILKRIENGVYDKILRRKCRNCDAPIRGGKRRKDYCSTKCRLEYRKKIRRLKYRIMSGRASEVEKSEVEASKSDGKLFRASDRIRFSRQHQGTLSDRIDAIRRSSDGRLVSVKVHSNGCTATLTMKCEKCGKTFRSIYSTLDAPRFCSDECAAEAVNTDSTPCDDNELLKKMIAAETILDDGIRERTYDALDAEHRGDITAMVAIKVSRTHCVALFKKLSSRFPMLPHSSVASAWKTAKSKVLEAKKICIKKREEVKKEAREKALILKRIEQEKHQKPSASEIRRRKSAEWAEEHHDEIQSRRDFFAKSRMDKMRKSEQELRVDRRERMNRRKSALEELRRSGMMKKYGLVKKIAICKYCNTRFPYIEVPEGLRELPRTAETAKLWAIIKSLRWAKCCCSKCSAKYVQQRRSSGYKYGDELNMFRIVNRGTGFYAQGAPHTVFVKRKNTAAFISGFHGVAFKANTSCSEDSSEDELSNRLELISNAGDRADMLFGNFQ